MSNVIISPSILSANFANLEHDIKRVEDAGAKWLHIDVMDGHFVPNITIGVPVVKSIRRITDLTLDVHLMIENPKKYITPFINAGADIITVHYEATKAKTRSVLEQIKSNGVLAGLSIKPNTPPKEIEQYISVADLILVMTVEPGFGGQKFNESSLDKIKALRKYIDDNMLSCVIEVDGGINDKNAHMIIDAGANILVSGSYLFKGDMKENIKKLK